MSTDTTTVVTGTEFESSRRIDLRATIRRRLAAWHRRHVITRTAAALRSLDDATLRDIGLSRHRVLAAAIAAYEESERSQAVLAA